MVEVASLTASPEAFLDGRVDYSAIAQIAVASPDVLGEELASAWSAQYYSECPGKTELVDVKIGTMTYVFDIANSRTIGVYGTSAPNDDPRPEYRIHNSLSLGNPKDVRGHLAADSMGGGTDLNLVRQDGTLNNSGAWRAFEIYAQKNPGTFFAVQVEYEGDTDRPSGFVYGIMRDSQFEHQRFSNG